MTTHSNFFLIDTTGVANNKPMIIETVDEYLQKQQQKQQNAQKKTTSPNVPVRKTVKVNMTSSLLKENITSLLNDTTNLHTPSRNHNHHHRPSSSHCS